MNPYILPLHRIQKDQIHEVGGKGVHLGTLSRMEHIHVPHGFCISTAAYQQIMGLNPHITSFLDQLTPMKPHQQASIHSVGQAIRQAIESVSIPEDIQSAISHQLNTMGSEKAYAVRSSATAEDLPHASFAGQQDTYLNIIGAQSVLHHIKKCWASLFTDRAIIYRMRNQFDHRKVFISVIVQEMVFPQSSGILFTADPVSSNRNITAIDAGFGLGEAMVSGRVNADQYRVRNDQIIDKKIAHKHMSIEVCSVGGVQEQTIASDQQKTQVLDDSMIIALAKQGRLIEEHFGCPQDIEWCIHDEVIYILQSRPITTLYPIPDPENGQHRVYISGGHMQMMTDPIKPLGMFFFQIVVGDHPSKEIGGRLYMDITHDLASFFSRKITVFLMKAVGEDLMLNTVKGLLRDKAFIRSLPKGKRKVFMPDKKDSPSMGFIRYYLRFYRQNDPDNIRHIIDKDQALITALQQQIDRLSGSALFDYIDQTHRRMKSTVVTTESTGALTVALLSKNWINSKVEKWLGEKNVADTLIQSVPNSITADTGNDLLDVADSVRNYPEIIAYLQDNPSADTFFDDLSKLAGGQIVIQSIQTYLDKYGVRCSGDIDITRPRWYEDPTALIPSILSNIHNFPPYAHAQVHQQGLQASKDAEEALLTRIRQLPGGKRKAKIAQKKISVVRNHIGYREFPKFAFVQRYAIFKEAMLREAAQLVDKGILQEREDIFYLYFHELKQTVATQQVDDHLITKRKEDYQLYSKLTAPRVITTQDGIITGGYDNANIPADALPGIPVSAGIVEGRARVILDMADADVEEGDILVTSFTDPSWTPVFVSIKGLVTEIGGLVTHGAIIAREYGLPAVVSVENATQHIKDGDMIRVNGTEGYVEILS